MGATSAVVDMGSIVFVRWGDGHEEPAVVLAYHPPDVTAVYTTPAVPGLAIAADVIAAPPATVDIRTLGEKLQHLRGVPVAWEPLEDGLLCAYLNREATGRWERVYAPDGPLFGSPLDDADGGRRGD